MISALSAQRIPKNYQKKYTLEVLTKITPELYVDKQDLRNIDWLEYMFWLENVYGENSPEYLASMPDTSIFRRQLPADLVRIYKWDGPGYRLFPVLGVNYEQAKAYCARRTDRVAEQMLNQMKFIEYESPTRINFFSLSTYNAPEGLEFLIFTLGNDNAEYSASLSLDHFSCKLR